jgi:hypothetical protein
VPSQRTLQTSYLLLPEFHKITPCRHQTLTFSAYLFIRKVKRAVRDSLIKNRTRYRSRRAVFPRTEVLVTANKEAIMEFVILSLLAATLLVLWSLCLSRLSCPWQTRRERRAIEGPTHPTSVEQKVAA